MVGISLKNKIKIDWKDPSDGSEIYWHPKTDSVFLKTKDFDTIGLQLIGKLHGPEVSMRIYVKKDQYYVMSSPSSIWELVLKAKFEYYGIQCTVKDLLPDILAKMQCPSEDVIVKGGRYQLNFPTEADLGSFIFYFGDVIERLDN